MFEDAESWSRTLEVFDQYCQTMESAGIGTFSGDLGAEVRERLQQLIFILKRVRCLEADAEQAVSRANEALREHFEDIQNRGVPYESVPIPPETAITRGEARRFEAAIFEMQLMTEAFYYFAGRIRTILQNKRGLLPGLQSFECGGVRDVRNKLLEHAEGKDSGISIQSFGFGAARGPVIKALRYAGQEDLFRDRGLFENAREFRLNLERSMQQALKVRNDLEKG